MVASLAFSAALDGAAGTSYRICMEDTWEKHGNMRDFDDWVYWRMVAGRGMVRLNVNVFVLENSRAATVCAVT